MSSMASSSTTPIKEEEEEEEEEDKNEGKEESKIGSSDEDDDDDDLAQSIGALNIDWTNRTARVNTQNTLAIGVRESLSSIGSPSIVAVTEVPGLGWIKKFERDTKYTGVHMKATYGYMYTSWDSSQYDLREVHYPAGKRYMAVLLEQKDDIEGEREKKKGRKKRILHVSTHLPTKGRWDVHAQSIMRLLEDYKDSRDLDQISVAGDFNASPEKIVKFFDSDIIHPAITCAHKTPTTKAGHTIDNILTDRAFKFADVTIDDKNDRFSHFPLSVTTKK